MADIDEVSDFFRTIETIFHDIDRKLRSGFSSNTDFNETVTLLQRVRVNVCRLRNVLPETECRSLLDTLDTMLAILHQHPNAHGVPDDAATSDGIGRVQGPRGPPSFDVTGDQLQHLLRQGWSVTAIAKNGLLGKTMHRNTVYRHMRKNGLESSKRMYSATEDEVRQVIRDYISNHRNAGYEETRAYLTTRQPPIHISRDRVRAIMADLDPEGVAVRWRNVVQRRQYSVEGPNSLWHIDGHHKLVRCKIYIHAGIDGFSRLIPYIRASCYNTARVAFESFLTGVQRHCIPSRVRLDEGVENGLISSFMTTANGEDRGSAMTGKSVHNQRIERLWRDVRTKVVSIYLNLLGALEESGALDVENTIQLYALQFVILPSLNRVLEEWRRTHNSHRVRTMNNRTPDQMWLSGLVALRDRDSTAVVNIQQARDLEPMCRQIVPDFNLSVVNDVNVFNLPRPCNDISPDIVDRLKGQFGLDGCKIEECIDMYGEVLTFLNDALSL